MNLKIILFCAFLFQLISCAKSGNDEDLKPATRGDLAICFPGEMEESPFLLVSDQPTSTFGVDVDTASYTYARTQIHQGQWPKKDSLRSEEFINYFTYQTPSPQNGDPIGVFFETSQAPWKKDHRLVKIALKAKDLPPTTPPPLNLVFLIDVSGSMNDEGKLDLIKYALNNLSTELKANDRLSVVTYSTDIETPIEGAHGNDVTKIQSAVSKLVAAGGTAGHAGLQRAYELAQKFYLPNGENRVVLSTDGDFNVGISNPNDLKKYVHKQAQMGVNLSVHGYGMMRANDKLLEVLADNANGSYAFIDNRAEAKKVFSLQLLQTLTLVAQDVKLQLQFNPEVVHSYRLIGYENRRLTESDFETREVDTGDMGAGHQVTAFYELILKESFLPTQKKSFDLKIKYIDPHTKTDRSIETASVDLNGTLENSSEDFRFASAVTAFALHLGKSKYLNGFNLEDVLKLAKPAVGKDLNGERSDFLRLVETTIQLEKPKN
ncbi:DUF3520 domain-containing protein [bacterium]|nr:DUF3520 domain-containing protein [bacterium]